jgi:diaminopimelate decarboxylase
VRAAGLSLVLEPGRTLVGDAGVLLTRVEYLKRAGKTFVIVDGGMSELIRPSHYGGYHRVERVDTTTPRPKESVDVVGPICETGDFLARDRVMEVPEPGELLAVRTVGAYGFSMASNYNGRLRPAECLVDGDEVQLIRRRETLDDLIRGES